MIPNVKPTVPTADAASNRQLESGSPSYTLIVIPPAKNKIKYIIAIFEVEVPKEWIGKTVGKLDIRKKYDINIMAVKDDGKVSMAISADTCFKEDVTLLVLGEYKAIKKCFCI